MLKEYVMLFICLLMLPGLACELSSGGLPVETETPIPTYPVTATPLISLSPTSPATAVAASTPSPTIPSPTTQSCTYNVTFIADVTISDDTAIIPGTAFTKTWRIQNSGTCAWKQNTIWVFSSGSKMNGPDSVSLPPLEPGETAEITVDLIAPDTPGPHIGYWQVQLDDGTRLSERFFVRVNVLAPTAPATATATTTSPVMPVIEYFQADKEIADPGESIELSWSTHNSDMVTLYRLVGYQLSTYWEVEATGVMSYTINENERNSVSFMLFAGREGDEEFAQATATIPLTCPASWFFSPAPDECPFDPALYSDGVEQPFENGVMIWVKEQKRIYVLFADSTSPKWNIFTDEWMEGDPLDDPDIEPSPGCYQPVRGFGLVWREQSDVRDRLGWATRPEVAFSTAYQTTSRFKYNEFYLRALNGNLWRLLPERSGWEEIISDD